MQNDQWDDGGWMSSSLQRPGWNPSRPPFPALTPSPGRPSALGSPGRTRGAHLLTATPGRGRSKGRVSGLAIAGCGPCAAALRLTLRWEAGSLGCQYVKQLVALGGAWALCK